MTVRARVPAIASGLALAASASASASELPTTAGWVGPAIEQEVGSRAFGCALVRSRDGRPSGLTVKVTTNDALRRARKIVRRMDAEGYTRVQRTAQKFSAERMRRVQAWISASRPADWIEEVAVTPGATVDTPGCPRVLITLSPHATVAMAAWARTQRARFGADRVDVARSLDGLMPVAALGTP